MNKKLIGAAIAMGAIVGISELLMSLENNVSAPTIDAYRPIREDVFCQKINGDFLSDWFDERKKKHGSHAIYFLARMTEKTMRMFAMDKVPAGINMKHYLIMAIVDKEQNLPKAVCLVNFSEIDQALEEILGDQEYMLIED